MLFLNPMLVAIGAILLVPTEACKCWLNGAEDFDSSLKCCGNEGGVWQDGNDCQASSIQNQLSQFQWCCGNLGTVSDCWVQNAEKFIDIDIYHHQGWHGSQLMYMLRGTRAVSNDPSSSSVAVSWPNIVLPILFQELFVFQDTVYCTSDLNQYIHYNQMTPKSFCSKGYFTRRDDSGGELRRLLDQHSYKSGTCWTWQRKL